MDNMIISSIIVQARPEVVTAVSTQAAAMSGVEVHATDPAGKIVIVLENRTDGELSDCIAEINAIEGVLSANLVFHHTDKA